MAVTTATFQSRSGYISVVSEAGLHRGIVRINSYTTDENQTIDFNDGRVSCNII